MLNDPAEPILPGPGPGTGASTGTPPGGAREAAGQVASTASERGSEVAGHAAERGSEVAGHAAERGSEVAGHAAEQAGRVAGMAAEQARSLAGQAKDQARTIVEDAGEQVRTQTEQQAKRAASSIRSTSDQLRALAEGRTDEAGQAGDLARQLADQLASVAERVDNEGIEGVVREVSSFARRRPGLFLLGAAATGFAVGRMVRNAGDGGSSGTTSGPSYQGAVTGPTDYDYLTGAGGAVAVTPAVGTDYGTGYETPGAVPAPSVGGWSDPVPAGDYGGTGTYATPPGPSSPPVGPGSLTDDASSEQPFFGQARESEDLR